MALSRRLVAPVPGLPVAFTVEPGEVRALRLALETLAIALTPGMAATVLVPSGGCLLVAWLVAIVVWRRFTLAPLMGLVQRSQLQRDLAVAAAETERARLAADLHDDALQQLTMLVRTLDECGHKEEADEAREVATKLRSVVGDLRLPILDDLGAGAALEWLVERVEPLAGGPVKLERSDETRPPANVELAVFRVAQEALTNAIKHGSPPIAVRYDVRTDGRVTLAIDDAGDGHRLRGGRGGAARKATSACRTCTSGRSRSALCSTCAAGRPAALASHLSGARSDPGGGGRRPSAGARGHRRAGRSPGGHGDRRRRGFAG